MWTPSTPPSSGWKKPAAVWRWGRWKCPAASGSCRPATRRADFSRWSPLSDRDQADPSRQLRSARQVSQQIAHVLALAIRNRIERLRRLLLAVYPEGRIAEQLGAGGIPAGIGREEDLLAPQA